MTFEIEAIAGPAACQCIVGGHLQAVSDVGWKPRICQKLSLRAEVVSI